MVWFRESYWGWTLYKLCQLKDSNNVLSIQEVEDLTWKKNQNKTEERDAKRVVCFDSWDCGVTEKCVCALGAVKVMRTSSGWERVRLSQRKTPCINAETDTDIRITRSRDTFDTFRCFVRSFLITMLVLTLSTHDMSQRHRSRGSRPERTRYMCVAHAGSPLGRLTHGAPLLPWQQLKPPSCEEEGFQKSPGVVKVSWCRDVEDSCRRREAFFRWSEERVASSDRSHAKCATACVLYVLHSVWACVCACVRVCVNKHSEITLIFT